MPVSGKTKEVAFEHFWPTSQGRSFLGSAFTLARRDLLIGFESGRLNLIGEFETLTVAIALMIWGALLSSSQVMLCVDNEGAKFALIRGYSDSFAISLICHLVAQQLDDKCILPWYSRVPSPSNLADFPSRKVKHRY